MFHQGIIISSGQSEYGGVIVTQKKNSIRHFKISNDSDPMNTSYAAGKIGYHFFTKFDNFIIDINKMPRTWGNDSVYVNSLMSRGLQYYHILFLFKSV